MYESDLTQLIEFHPDRGVLPAACVKAVCYVESSFNEWAYRHEPQYRYLVGEKVTMTDTERMGQKTSWGLMQVMGGVAREHGFTGWFPELCSPVIGLLYGMKHLRKFFEQYGNWPDALASYNAGAPRKGTDGFYGNQHYVDAVLKHWKRFETPRPLTPTDV